MATFTRTQVIGGKFQDAEGNPLALGYLTLDLNQDENILSTASVCAGVEITINLDDNGSAISTTSTPTGANQFVWANDIMTPINSYYRVRGYNANGQQVFGPNNQQIISGGIGGSTFDLGTWVPNTVFSWTPPTQVLDVEVNGVQFSSESVINFENSGTVTFTDEGGGVLSASSSAGDSIKINSTPLSASTANFENSPTALFVDEGSGVINVNVNALPEPENSRVVMWQPNNGANSVTDAWLFLLDSISDSAGGGGGSLTVSFSPPTSAAGAAVQFEANTNQAGSITGQAAIWPGRKTTFKCTMLFRNDVVSGVGAICFWGLTNISANLTNLPNSGDFLGIAVSETAGVAGNILLVCSSGGTQTAVDSGIPATDVTGTAGIRYKIEVVLQSGTATLFVNGTSVATCTTHLPTNPLGLCWFQKADAGSNNVITLTEYMSAENATP